LRIPVSLLALFLLSGCETLSFYAQAVGGQLSMMARARPAAELIADPVTPRDLRERLKKAAEIRDFAVRELRLPDNASYRSYAELDRPYAVWNVVAAPEFSLDAVQSCFPVAGCVSYRGFFAQRDAEQHAAGLRAQGHDVYVNGVPAYSTLGRFDDPLLSTFIRYADTDLARLIFHELAHQVVYVKDDSTFNESFAVVVEREGIRRWLAAQGRSEDLKSYAASRARGMAVAAEIDKSRARLKQLYRQRVASELMRERKRAELDNLKAQLARLGRPREEVPNNAFLASYATYAELVTEFEFILKENDNDLERFYAQVKRHAASAPSNRGPLSKQSP